MTDNPQPWQPGQPPSNEPRPPQEYGAASPRQQPGAQQPGAQQPGAEQPDSPGGWQGTPPHGGWEGGPMQSSQGRPALAQGDERTWMLLAHLSAPFAAVFSLGLLSFLGPLVIWLLRKEDSQAVRTAAAGAFNFNLSFWVMNAIAWICLATVILIPLAIIIWVIVWPVAIYAHLRGAYLASKGQVYSYPFQLRILN